MRKEIYLFIQEMSIAKLDKFKSFFEDVELLSELAFITNLICHLNTLNLKLQKTNQMIYRISYSHRLVPRKIKIILNHLKRNNFQFFPSCNILVEEYGHMQY